MFLNLDLNEGVKGWRELPVHEMRRIENGMDNMYGAGMFNASFTQLKPDEVKFVWEGHNEDRPFKNWMIAHFRLITDSIFLPYGCSWLNKARRHWRMLSMMEDAMLLYRLERSIFPCSFGVLLLTHELVRAPFGESPHLSKGIF